jgi:hypothetical protein
LTVFANGACKDGANTIPQLRSVLDFVNDSDSAAAAASKRAFTN